MRNEPDLFWLKVRFFVYFVGPWPIAVLLLFNQVGIWSLIPAFILAMAVYIEKCPVCGEQVFRRPDKSGFYFYTDIEFFRLVHMLIKQDKLLCFDNCEHGPREKFRYE